MATKSNDSSTSRASGTPGILAKLPSHADLLSNPNLGPIRNSRDARKWLDSKGWILSEEPYDRSKIVRILLTAAALPKVPTEASIAIRAAAFLIEENVLDTNASRISDALATKITPLLTNILPDLSPTKSFIDAITSQQADTLSDLKDIVSSHSSLSRTLSSSAIDISAHTEQLRVNAERLTESIDKFTTSPDTPSSTSPPSISPSSVDLSLLASATDALSSLTQKQSDIASKLDAISAKLSSSPALSSFSPAAWPSLHSTAPSHASAPPVPHTYNANFPTHFVRTQQRLLQSSRTILIPYDPSDNSIAQHNSPADLSLLRNKLNEALVNLDDLEFAYEDPSTKRNTIVSGIQHLDRNAFLLDMDSPDSALRFKKYALERGSSLVSSNFGDSAFYKPKEYPVIFKFVPCKDDFDPTNTDHLSLVEKQNGFAPGTISKAHWIKSIDRRAANQSFASLKVICSSPVHANSLLQNRVFVLGHKVTVCKDIREPVRCNKCQQYGHIRAKCPNPELCAFCASPDHNSLHCAPNHPPRCVSCGPTSTHNSVSRKCPTFISKCAALDSRFPENSMPLFPTEDPSTWVLVPSKLSVAPPPHVPRRTLTSTALNSLHPTTSAPSSQTRPPPAPNSSAPSAPSRQSTLTHFLSKPPPRSQRSQPSTSSTPL
jgi:hypothetical protein